MQIRLRPPALELFCTQSSLGKIGKDEPWTLEIISDWSDKLSSILDYFTFDPQKKYFTNSVQKSGVICLSRPRIPARLRVLKSSRTTSPRPRVPASPSPRVPKSHVPRPRPTFSNSHVDRTCEVHVLSCSIVSCQIGQKARTSFFVEEKAGVFTTNLSMSKFLSVFNERNYILPKILQLRLFFTNLFSKRRQLCHHFSGVYIKCLFVLHQ